MLKDERKTLRVNVRDEDDWKEHKDNWRTGNNRIPFKGPKWTGRTIFTQRTRKQYLSAPSINTCNLGTIPLKEMFFVGYVSTKPVPKHLVISFVFGTLKAWFWFFGK